MQRTLLLEVSSIDIFGLDILGHVKISVCVFSLKFSCQVYSVQPQALAVLSLEVLTGIQLGRKNISGLGVSVCLHFCIVLTGLQMESQIGTVLRQRP